MNWLGSALDSALNSALTLLSPSTSQRPPRMLMNPVCAIFVTYYAYTYACIYIYLVSL